MARSPIVAYIASAPAATRKPLTQLRAAIRAAVPGLTERISYGIPTFDLDGRRLLYIAGFKQHVSLYPITAAMSSRYAKQIAPYRSGRGTLRFELGARLPLRLVAQLARVRAREHRASERRR